MDRRNRKGSDKYKGSSPKHMDLRSLVGAVSRISEERKRKTVINFFPGTFGNKGGLEGLLKGELLNF